ISQSAKRLLRTSMRATMARMLGWSAELACAAAVLLRAKYSLSALVTTASMSGAGTRTIAPIGGVASPDAAEREIPAKDHADPLGLLVDDGQLAILGFVSQRHHSADPQPLALGGRYLVANALGGYLRL